MPVSLALTEYTLLVFPRQMNIQISWTMVVHELATVGGRMLKQVAMQMAAKSRNA